MVALEATSMFRVFRVYQGRYTLIGAHVSQRDRGSCRMTERTPATNCILNPTGHVNGETALVAVQTLDMQK